MRWNRWRGNRARNEYVRRSLNQLRNQGLLEHPALHQGLEKLYGYTSDEQGVRHSLLDQGQSNVGQDEAVFMLGACASFASYLWRKGLGCHREIVGATLVVAPLEMSAFVVGSGAVECRSGRGGIHVGCMRLICELPMAEGLGVSS